MILERQGENPKSTGSPGVLQMTQSHITKHSKGQDEDIPQTAQPPEAPQTEM